MESPSFDQFSEFICSWAAIPARIRVTPTSQFERDLGIYGADGDDLLKATEEKFGISLSRDTFNLEPDEYLFSAEGWGPALGLISLFNCPHVRSFTTGELYEAVVKAVEEKSRGG